MKTREDIRQEILNRIKKIPDKPSDDLLIETLRELYEKCILLKYADDSDKKTSIRAEAPAAEPVVAEKKQATIDLFSSRTASQTESAQAIPEKSVTKENKEPLKKPNESVAEKIKQKKITDLKASIGINEKFQFINQLFEGNMKEYTVAVDQINSFSNHEEAMSYITNLQGIYKWNADEPITVNFLELVQRRFL